MEVKFIPNYPVTSNCYVLHLMGENECLILDPGTNDCNNLINYLDEFNLIPYYVILTHEHFDHIWGVNKLRELFDIKIIASRRCSEKIGNRKQNLSLYYDQIGFEVSNADIIFDNSFNFVWKENLISLFETPGHSEGSICVSINHNLFSGDTIIKGQKTVTKLPGSSKSSLLQSLNYIYYKCNSKNIVFPGHGESFILKEFELNVFL